MDGWIKLHRKLLDNPIWKLSTPEQKSILITLMCFVNHDEEEWEWKGKKYNCKPGQKITSLQKIATAAGNGISVRNVRTAIERFKKLDFLTNESTKASRLITILNWHLYQLEENNRQRSSPTGDKGVTTNKNVRTKEVKEDKELIADKSANRQISGYFCKMYLEKYETKYMFQGAKDGTALSNLLKNYDVDFLEAFIDWYFTTKDEFVLKTGREISKMPAQVAKYIQEKTEKPLSKTQQKELEFQKRLEAGAARLKAEGVIFDDDK